MWGHSDSSLFLTILASEKLFIDLGGGSDALTEIDQMPEAFYTPKMGQAIMNRLLKAAGHKIINVGGGNQ